MKPIQVGLLGIGTVGSGVFNVLARNQEEIRRRAGRGIEIACVADLNVERARSIVGDKARAAATARRLAALFPQRFYLELQRGGMPAHEAQVRAAVPLAAELGLGDSVIFAGVRSNIQSFYDAMDAFLLPSLFEGLPVVLVEAQTAGLPCFVADTVDRGAAFSDKVKFLPLNDTAAWANTIAAASFRRDPQAREKAIKAGYDIHTSAEVLQAFYLRRYAEVTP